MKISADSKSLLKEHTVCLQCSTLSYSSLKREELLGQNPFKCSHLLSQNSYLEPEVHTLSSKNPLPSIRTCLARIN